MTSPRTAKPNNNPVIHPPVVSVVAGDLGPNEMELRVVLEHDIGVNIRVHELRATEAAIAARMERAINQVVVPELRARCGSARVVRCSVEVRWNRLPSMRTRKIHRIRTIPTIAASPEVVAACEGWLCVRLFEIHRAILGSTGGG
jgi:hypothetical protein